MRAPASRAADAVHDIRGFAPRLAEEGNWDVVGKPRERSTVV
jgi:catalase